MECSWGIFDRKRSFYNEEEWKSEAMLLLIYRLFIATMNFHCSGKNDGEIFRGGERIGITLGLVLCDISEENLRVKMGHFAKKCF